MLLDRFIPQTDFLSYEDFVTNFKITIPEDFNFAYDMIDALAQQQQINRDSAYYFIDKTLSEWIK